MRQKIQSVSKRQIMIFSSVIVFTLVGCYLLLSANGLSGDNGHYDLHITKTSVISSQVDSGISRATVDITLTNTSNDILQVSPGLQMFLTTDSGKVYNMTAKYLGKDEVIGGPIAVNDFSKMLVDFDIPSTETPKTFTFQPDLSKPITVLGL